MLSLVFSEFNHNKISEAFAELIQVKFDLVDKDQTGGISKNELTDFINHFGVDELTLEGLIALEDVNGDSEISLEGISSFTS